jgi:hypothetical protein
MAIQFHMHLSPPLIRHYLKKSTLHAVINSENKDLRSFAAAICREFHVSTISPATSKTKLHNGHHRLHTARAAKAPAFAAAAAKHTACKSFCNPHKNKTLRIGTHAWPIPYYLEVIPLQPRGSYTLDDTQGINIIT